jgi:hypothetical protein
MFFMPAQELACMEQGLVGWFVLGAIIIVIGVLILSGNGQFTGCREDAKLCPDGSYVGRVPPDCNFEPCPGEGEFQHSCTGNDRAVAACIEIYLPVCGWFDTDEVNCDAYPCARTYSNSCFACIDTSVLYWTPGECPAPIPS